MLRYDDDTLGHLQHLSGYTLFSPFRGLVIGANHTHPISVHLIRRLEQP